MKGKQFVIAMIIVATLGTMLVMIGMFVGVRGFLDNQKPIEQLEQEAPLEEVTVPTINSVILGVVEEVTPEVIKIQDIEKKQEVEAVITLGTQIMDAYQKPMPLDMIQIGDVVQLTYDANESILISINTYSEAFKKQDTRVSKIDRSNKIITIGASVYRYTDQTIMMDEAGNPIGIYEIGDYDTLSLKGVGQDIYSIVVTAKEAYLEIKNIPTNEGVIEINTNRQIPVGTVTGRIPLSAGAHKVVVRLEGYEIIIEEFTFEEAEVITLDLAIAKRLTVDLDVQVLNQEIETYQVIINGIPYQAGESITLFAGDHKVEVRAAGYIPWIKQVRLVQGEVTLPIQLEQIPVEEDEAEDEGANSDESTDSGDGLYTVSITTDPIGANLFIEDEKKGETPIQLELPVGTYTLTLDAEGYESYKTTILIEASDTKNNYYYMLIEE